MDVEDSITINEAYASKYEQKKRAEELSKRKNLIETLADSHASGKGPLSRFSSCTHACYCVMGCVVHRKIYIIIHVFSCCLVYCVYIFV